MSSSARSGPGGAGGITRCPACGSRLRPDEDWCSLCHHDLRAPEPTAAFELAADPESTAGPDRSDPRPPPSAGAEPITSRPVDPAVAAEADRLLAALRSAEADRARESRLGALYDRFGGRAGGLILASVGGVLLLVIGVLGLVLLGLLL